MTMKQEINPQDTSRAQAFNHWMSASMPMVTIVKTMNVSNLLKFSKKRNIKFNTLMCWCIGESAIDIKEFYLLPERGKLFQYDKIAVSMIVLNKNGGINSCDIPFSTNLQLFNHNYLELTAKVAEECKSIELDDYMVIGTSTVPRTELDCISIQYSEKYPNPMVMWGKYRKSWFKATLPISFQFHHVQLDGGEAARFLDTLQSTMDTL